MFRKRSYKKELLDNVDLAGPELDQNLRELHTINSFLGGYDVTLSGLSVIQGNFSKPKHKMKLLYERLKLSDMLVSG